jgi:hypothetical protein
VSRFPTHRRERLAGVAPLVLASLGVAAVLGGCAPAPTELPPAAEVPVTAAERTVVESSVPLGLMRRPTDEEIEAAWATRPAYVTDLPAEWQSAYAYALARPDVLQWLPCYCGCGGMGHRSNLDCFFQRREDGTFTWEEHASFCDVCVDTANLAATMLHGGSTIREIRAAVDARYGPSGVPGTDTAHPPA